MGINIDFKLLPMKAHYFLYNAGTGSVVPYMPVLARQLGLSSFVVGSIYTVLPILGLISKPLFGVIADRYQRHKSMFIFFILLTVVSFFSVQFIPSITKSTQINFHCNDGSAVLKYCPQQIDHCASDLLLSNRNETKLLVFDLYCEVKEDWIWDFICQKWSNGTNCVQEDNNMIHLKSSVNMTHIEKQGECIDFIKPNTSYHNKLIDLNGEAPVHVVCPHKSGLKEHDLGSLKLTCSGTVNDELVMNAIVGPGIINNSEAMQYSQFWYFFIAVAISWIGMAVVVSVGDAICFDLLGKRHELYGRQRLWGAVGFGIFSLMSGTLVDYISGQTILKNYTIIYYLMAAALLPNTMVSSCLEFKPNKFSSHIIRDIGKLFKSARIVVFFLWCIVVGLCTALIWNFLLWHLEELAEQADCGQQMSMKTLQGLVSGIQCFGGELPFFFIAGWFINKIGHVKAMTLVLFVMGIRLTLYSYLTNPWWAIPIEFSQGITSGIFYATMVTYANAVAPSGTAATLQGLVGAIFEGIGVSSGSFICGYLMETYGSSWAFFIFGIGAICMGFVHYFVQRFLDSCTSKHDYRSAQYSQPNDDFQMLQDADDFY